MRNTLRAVLLITVTLHAGEKRLPSGQASNDAVGLTATAYDADQLKQTFGMDFEGSFAVVEVTVTPKGGKPLELRLDDFLLRSAQTGEHSGPLAASQIAGSESLVVNRGTQNGGRGKGGFGGGFGGIMMGGGGSAAPVETNTGATIKDSDRKDPVLVVLRRKILAEKTVTEPATGLLFFPMEKEKPKHLTLIYTTSAGKLRVEFK